ncbi:Gfo/Idh/MocA family protein [Paenibacillus sinopodophylli]|uniref:Gfo/Idh/MocA family protein n=1 Tax=Paenibacillus sinopodophylli TaxID=1837342 RepID=UPI00110C9668|nr:Gfo/Idh/MocA family oxidoreductase [Paenibacillus sinopodophylli]
MRKFKVGFVGAGAVTRLHLRGYANHQNRVEIVAMCDPSEAAVNERADEFGIAGRYTDVNEMIRSAGIEVAVVCTPSTIRQSVITPLLQAGIPVFVEKPFADTLAEAEAIAKEAASLSVPVSVNQNFRRHHKFEFIRGLIEEGVIGKLEGIHFASMFYRQDAGWRIHTERHAMSVMAIHWFDGIRRIANAEAESIYCTTYSSAAIECLGETDATVQITFANGVKAHFTQSFSSPLGKDDLVVLGSEGVISTTNNEIKLYRKDPSGLPNWNPTPVQTWNEALPIEEAIFDGLDQLLNWIETGIEAANSASDNLHTVSLLDGAYLSAKDNKVITFNKGLL